MSLDALWKLPVTELGARIADKTLSPVDLLEMYLARCDRLNPQINAIVVFDREGARAQARASERRALSDLADKESALRLFRDNAELLETRFRDDYTDPDPMLSETLYVYGTLADANGQEALADSLWRQAGKWGWTDFRGRLHQESSREESR